MSEGISEQAAKEEADSSVAHPSLYLSFLPPRGIDNMSNKRRDKTIKVMLATVTTQKTSVYTEIDNEKPGGGGVTTTEPQREVGEHWGSPMHHQNGEYFSDQTLGEGHFQASKKPSELNLGLHVQGRGPFIKQQGGETGEEHQATLDPQDRESMSVVTGTERQSSTPPRKETAIATTNTGSSEEACAGQENEKKPSARGNSSAPRGSEPPQNQQILPSDKGTPVEDESMLKTEKPRDYDVLCGRGRAYSKRPGNSRMQAIIGMRQAEYDLSKRLAKATISRELVRAIKWGGHRFLRKNKTHNVWLEVSDEEARLKVTHALRDARPKPTRTQGQEETLLESGLPNRTFGTRSPLAPPHPIIGHDKGSKREEDALIVSRFLASEAYRKFCASCNF